MCLHLSETWLVNLWNWNGLHPPPGTYDPEEIDWFRQENCTDIGGFPKLSSNHTKIIKQYAHIALPLYTIGTLQNGNGYVGCWRGEVRKVMRTPFTLDREWQHAFNTLKEVLHNDSVLALPDPEPKFCLHIYGSHYASGMVLSLVPDNAEKALDSFSRKLHNVEMGYPEYDRELLGIPDSMLD